MACYKHSDCDINVLHHISQMYYHGNINMHNNCTVKAQGLLHLHVLCMNTLPMNIFESKINWHCPKVTLRYAVCESLTKVNIKVQGKHHNEEK